MQSIEIKPMLTVYLMIHRDKSTDKLLVFILTLIIDRSGQQPQNFEAHSSNVEGIHDASFSMDTGTEGEAPEKFL